MIAARLGWERTWFSGWLTAGLSVILLACVTLIAILTLFLEGSLPIETVVTLAAIDSAVVWLWKPAQRLRQKQEHFFELQRLGRQQ
jgi:hypothetical protein